MGSYQGWAGDARPWTTIVGCLPEPVKRNHLDGTHPIRRGLGRRVLDWLLADIRQRAPHGAYVSLVADPPGQPLYRKLGFSETLPGIAMALKLPE
jgi:hypothetical protein